MDKERKRNVWRGKQNFHFLKKPQEQSGRNFEHRILSPNSTGNLLGNSNSTICILMNDFTRKVLTIGK